MIASHHLSTLLQDQPRAAAASISAPVGATPLAGGGGALEALSTAAGAGAGEALASAPPPPPPQAVRATQVNKAASAGR